MQEIINSDGSESPDAFWSGLCLSKRHHALLSKMLTNETDMAFRRRALVVFSYLEPKDDDSILECGCGRGFYLNMMRELSNCHLTGVELDQECLEIASKKMAGKKVNLSKANIERLPFASDSFDKILFSEVLEHIPNDVQALREIFRVLKPGGILALTTPNADYPFLWDPINWLLETIKLSPIRKGIMSGIWANHERLYKSDDLRTKAGTAGFEILDQRWLTYYCFPFAHNIVYGFGKELLIRGLLPKSIADASDRFTYSENKGSLLNPVNLMRSVFRKIDKLNDKYPLQGPSVVHALKLRKPFNR